MNRAGPTDVGSVYNPESSDDTRRPSIHGSSIFVFLIKTENDLGPFVPVKRERNTMLFAEKVSALYLGSEKRKD